MEQKKLIQIAVISLIGIWTLCLSTVASVTVGRRMLEQSATTTVPATQYIETTTQATTTEAPSTTRLPVGGNIVTSEAVVDDPEWLVEEEESKKVSAVIEEVNKNNTTTKKSSASSNVPSGKSEIIKTYVDAVNKLKNSSDFSLYKDDKLNVSIDKITGGDLVQSFANNLIAQNQKVPITYNFVGGTDASTGLTPNQAIAPLNISASVDESAVASATAKATSDGGFTISLALTSEDQTMTSPAPNHATMVEVVDVTPLIPSGATVNYFNMTYTNTKIDAVFDKDGRITSMKHYLNVDKAEGTARVTLLGEVELALHGEFTSDYTFSY